MVFYAFRENNVEMVFYAFREKECAKETTGVKRGLLWKSMC